MMSSQEVALCLLEYKSETNLGGIQLTGTASGYKQPTHHDRE